MDWGQIFSLGNLGKLVLPVGAGIVIIIITLVLRHYLYRYVHKLTAKTRTCFDDILVKDTGLATVLWCIWSGLLAGFTIAETPVEWNSYVNQTIPVVFVALGIYTLIVILMVVFKWYKCEICTKTVSSIDDAVISVLLAGTPIIGGTLGIILILKMLGHESQAVNSFFSSHGASLAALTIGIVLLLLITVFAVPKMVRAAVRNSRAEQNEEELNKRADTLISVISTTLQILFIAIYIIMILDEFTINITAILAGVSVVGIALGFGAQSLVKDVLSGLFIIMENQYRKGDVVKIADSSGVVEEINLRRTLLRDANGIIHCVPNGEIKVSSNYTKMWSRVNFNIGVSYDTDLDYAIKVINQVGQELFNDPVWQPALINAPKAMRVDNLGDSSVEIKIMGDTKPSRQWEVTGELRLRLKKAFDKAGIEIPWPHTKVYFGNSPLELRGSISTKENNKTEQ